MTKTIGDDFEGIFFDIGTELDSEDNEKQIPGIVDRLSALLRMISNQ